MNGNYAACPQCGGTNAQSVNFTWWGGVLGPKLLSMVKCQQCGKKYNGKSGKDSTTGIVLYLGVSFILGFLLLGVIAAIAVMR